jgi:hypothetical protein
VLDHVTIRASDRAAPDRFCAFLLDPDGSNVAVVNHSR